MVVERSTATATVDGRRDRGPQLRHQRLHPVDRGDDVGAGLPVEDDQHRRLAVGETGIAEILDRIGYLADVGKPDRRAVAIGDDQRSVLRPPCWPGRWRRSGSAGRRRRWRLSGCGRWRWRAPPARPPARCRICRAPAGLSSTRTAGSELPPTTLRRCPRPARVSAPARWRRRRRAGRASGCRTSASGSGSGRRRD